MVEVSNVEGKLKEQNKRQKNKTRQKKNEKKKTNKQKTTNKNKTKHQHQLYIQIINFIICNIFCNDYQDGKDPIKLSYYN